MAIEYLYWALTSILGAQDHPGRRENIKHEWKLYSQQLVRDQDTKVRIVKNSLKVTYPNISNALQTYPRSMPSSRTRR